MELMMKNIRKILILCLFMSFFGIHAFAKEHQDMLAGLGIAAEEAEDESPLTRGEAARFAVLMSGADEELFNAEQTVFSDMPAGHPLNGAVAAAYTAGIVKGDENGNFNPDEAVGYTDFLKMMCCVLNYSAMAEARGGYPEGYSSVAAAIGLYAGSIKNADAITLGEAKSIMESALDVKPYTYSGENGTIAKEDKTLFEMLMDKKGLIYITGTVMENYETALYNAVPSVEEGRIVIDETAYVCGQNDHGLLGYWVIAYVSDDTGEIRYMAPRGDYNTEISVDENEFIELSGSSVLYQRENENRKTVRLSADAVYIYNGRKASGFRELQNGSYRFIDNNRDGFYDIVFISDRQSFIAEKVNEITQTVFFKDKRTLNKKNAFEFTEENSKVLSVYKEDGTPAEFSDISIGAALTFISSEDGDLNKVYISSKTVTGRVEAVDSDGKMLIGGTFYPVVKNSDGSFAYQGSAGDSGTYVIDAFGYLTGISGEAVTETGYGYAVNAYCDTDSDEALYIKLIDGSEKYKETVTKNDTETISWYFTNNEPKTLKCSDKVRIDGSRTNAVSEQSAALIKGNMISYKINSAGEIADIVVYPCREGSVSYSFNAKILSFGGFVETAYDRAFLIGEQTAVICVPTKSDASAQDYLPKVKISDKSGGWKVCSVNIDEKTKIADCVVIYADMDYNVPSAIQYDDPIYMVGDIASVYGDGEQLYELTVLYKDEQKKLTSRSSGAAYETIKTLKEGDLIRYTEDHGGNIDGIVKIGGIDGLSTYFQKDVGDGNRLVYGVVEDITLDSLYSVGNEMVDEVTIGLGGDKDPVLYRISKEDDPPVYLYDRKRGWISAASTDIIASSASFGDDASKILLYVYNTEDVQAVVVIED